MPYKHLVFTSSKIGFNSQKLALKTHWQQCEPSGTTVLFGYDGLTGSSGYLSSWAYPNQQITNAYNMAVGANPVIYSDRCWASLYSSHGHGCTGYPSSADHSAHLPMENYAEYGMGYVTFLRPSGGPSTISVGVIRLYNCGRVLHTERHGYSPSAYDAHFETFRALTAIPAIIGDGSIYLSLTFFIDADHLYEFTLPLGTIRGLNTDAGNGIIVAGVEVRSYKMNGFLDISLPSGVLNLLNQHQGIHLFMRWKWGSGIIGPYCAKCLGDYYPQTTAAMMAASSINSNSYAIAADPELWIA